MSGRVFEAFVGPDPDGDAGQSVWTGDARIEMGGVTVVHPAPSAAGLSAVLDRLEGAGTALLARPAAEIAKTLGLVGARFLDPDDPIRAEALELLPDTAQLSAPMAEAVLDGMAADWTADRLQALLEAELGAMDALDRFRPGGEGRTLAIGPRLCVQIVAGSVPGVGVAALQRSLLVKAPTLLKPGLGDVVLPVLFARALREADPVLADALAVLYWPGGNRGLEDVALRRADLVTAYGGDRVVGELRSRAPATTRVVAYHHRVGVGVIAGPALGAETAGEVARAVALFDQRGCVSSRVLFVQEGGATSPAEFARLLGDALSALEAELPGAPLDESGAAALQQARGTLEMLAASTPSVELTHGGGQRWTVLYEGEASPVEEAPGRFVRVRPFGSVGELPARLVPLAGHLQTVGVAGLRDDEALRALAAALGRLGASRIVPFRGVAFPPPWWHHDGGGPLRDLVRYVDVALQE